MQVEKEVIYYVIAILKVAGIWFLYKTWILSNILAIREDQLADLANENAIYFDQLLDKILRELRAAQTEHELRVWIMDVKQLYDKVGFLNVALFMKALDHLVKTELIRIQNENITLK